MINFENFCFIRTVRFCTCGDFFFRPKPTRRILIYFLLLQIKTYMKVWWVRQRSAPGWLLKITFSSRNCFFLRQQSKLHLITVYVQFFGCITGGIVSLQELRGPLELSVQLSAQPHAGLSGGHNHLGLVRFRVFLRNHDIKKRYFISFSIAFH